MPASGFGYFPATPANRTPLLANPTQVDTGIGNGWGWPVATMPPSPDFTAPITPHALLSVIATRRGQPMGPSNDQEIEDFICDVLDVLPGANDVEVRCDGGRATLTGAVPHKRLKHDVGEIAWAIPNVSDVQNNITIATRRRSRTSNREPETTAAGGPGRKQA
jgi:hypothetical protein